MSVSSMGFPSMIPTTVVGKGAPGAMDPSLIFSSSAEKDKYRKLLEDGRRTDGIAPDVKFKKVVVRIFDLSDEKQVEEYEKLWLELLEKTARMEVSVESRKDLVHRKDGTSYWMKYVEYVEFGDAKESRNVNEPSDGEKEDK